LTPDSLHRLDALVLEAAALEGAERAWLLRRAEVEDPALAFEARRLLRAENHLTADFLRPPTASLLDALTRQPEEEPPADSDRYELGECLGHGGMSRVYKAVDHKLGRPVALKILTSRDPETPLRLLREARAQARVRHDHVLEVYDTGELDGRAYISVRFAAGGTLAELAPSASLESRVRLLAQAADGLHAAHREGLLHGDVKPSNILVEETPDGERALVGDFGIALELSREGQAAGVVGTPRYMAPELLQAGPAAAGDPGRASAAAAPDRRADVYSLGVTLFEVVAGFPPPGPTPTWAELRATAPDLPPDLLAAAARCLAHDPEDRYSSARAVARDLGRFLEGDVVSAYADRRAYRWARFAARHRRLLTVAGVSALLLAAALIAAAAMGVRAVRASHAAEQHRSQAEDLVDFMLLDLRDKLRPVGRLDLLDDVGDRAMEYFAAAPSSEASREATDEVLARRSLALYQIGEVRLNRGDLAGAERPFAESLALARRLAERDPGNPERLFGLGQSEFWAGYAHWKQGDREAARRHFQAYEEISRRLVAMDPERRDWRAELSYAHSNLGSVLEAQGDLDGALNRFLHSLSIDRQLAAETKTGADSEAAQGEALQRQHDLALTHNTVGVVLERLGRLDEALVHYRADLGLRRELVRRQPDNRQWQQRLATSRQYLGALHLARGEAAIARHHLRASRDVFVGLHRHDPANAEWRSKLAWAELRLGRVERIAGTEATVTAAWERAGEHAAALTATDPDRDDWRRLEGVVLLHRVAADVRAEGASRATVAADVTPATASREMVRDALALLEPPVRGGRDPRSASRWLAEALLLEGELADRSGEIDTARRSWHRALTTLADLGPAAATSRDHQILRPRERALRHLGRRAEADRLAVTLAELGIAAGE